MRNRTSGKKAGIGVVAVLSVAGVGAASMTMSGKTQENAQEGVVVVEGRYFCNVKALNIEERKRHEELTSKLLAKHREVVETDKGYEFQYTPEDVLYCPKTPLTERSGDIAYTLEPKGLFKGCRVFSSKSI